MLATALCIGLYLLWLWRPEHQVRLHTEHFFHAIDGRNWETAADFIGDDYRDQWNNDRARLLERMREGFRWVRGSRITAPEAAVQIEPAFSLVYFNLALVYHRVNNVNAAAAALARYRELAPEDKDIEALDELLRVRAEAGGRPSNPIT